MSTLADRYVWAVLRAVPTSKRTDLEPEIRALVLDTVDAHADAGTPDAAERAALAELGDPETLADRYLDRTRFLIGPRLFPEWQRLLTILLSIVVPIIAIVTGASRWMGGGTVGDVVLSASSAAFGVGVQLAFWFTLVFAIIERTGDRSAIPAREWTPEQLPDLPSTERMGAGDAVATVAANILVIVALLWAQSGSAVTIEGTGYPLFDPALWSFWLPYFIVLAGIEILFAVVLYSRGRWTWGLAAVNAALGAAFAIPALWLLQNGLLFNPDAVAAIGEVLDRVASDGWFAPTVTIIGIVIVVIVIWDAIDGFRKAWRNSRPTPLASPSA